MDKYKDYLRDLGFLIKEVAMESKHQYLKTLGSDENQFAAGYVMGLHRIVSLMQQQAKGFNISLKEICLEDIDPEEDLFT